MKTMTPEEKRVRIAELDGWEVPDHCMTKRLMRGETKRKCAGAPPDFGKHSSGSYGDLPDYLNSRDAIAEAIKRKFVTVEEMGCFLDHFERICWPTSVANFITIRFAMAAASAEQLADAYLEASK